MHTTAAGQSKWQPEAATQHPAPVLTYQDPLEPAFTTCSVDDKDFWTDDLDWWPTACFPQEAGPRSQPGSARARIPAGHVMVQLSGSGRPAADLATRQEAIFYYRWLSVLLTYFFVGSDFCFTTYSRVVKSFLSALP